jgi:hypothetical protein
VAALSPLRPPCAPLLVCAQKLKGVTQAPKAAAGKDDVEKEPLVRQERASSR